MPVSFRILRDRGLVYVRYWGFAGAEESKRAFAAYMQHPDCRPGQRHLVDMSDITESDMDFTNLMALQALKADLFVGRPEQTLLVYLAPNEAARRMARTVLRSWESFDHVSARVAETEAQALALLGEPERQIADLLADAG
ncbi:MAG: hypothetical protein R3D63_07425 [Paracoccaceae bacterium]